MATHDFAYELARDTALRDARSKLERATSAQLRAIARAYAEEWSVVPLNERLYAQAILQAATIKGGHTMEDIITSLLPPDDPKWEHVRLPDLMVVQVDPGVHELIDSYVRRMRVRNQRARTNDVSELDGFLQELVERSSGSTRMSATADLVLRQRYTGQVHVFELKHKNNHDSGKNPQIIRQLFEAIAAVASTLGIASASDIVPHIAFTNDNKTAFFKKFLPSPRPGDTTPAGFGVLGKHDFYHFLFEERAPEVLEGLSLGFMEASRAITAQLEQLRGRCERVAREIGEPLKMSP